MSKRGQQSRGRSISGFSTKLHLIISADGHVISGCLSGGNKADISMVYQIVDGIHGSYFLADKGYDSNNFRRVLKEQDNLAVIPGRRNRKVKIKYNKELYKMRGGIERLFGKIKENRRLSMRYDKSDFTFMSFIALAILKTIIR